jgi:hypothetical protein
MNAITGREGARSDTTGNVIAFRMRWLNGVTLENRINDDGRLFQDHCHQRHRPPCRLRHQATGRQKLGAGARMMRTGKSNLIRARAWRLPSALPSVYSEYAEYTK